MSDMHDQPFMGWVPDLPDFRDYTLEQDKVGDRMKRLGQVDTLSEMASKLSITKPAKIGLGTARDLRSFFSPVENQGTLGSCTAHAGVGLVEYFERRAFGKHIDASRLFLYKVTRRLLNWTGDTGAYLRSTMAALTLFGTPPERYWPYDVTKFDVEPEAFLYAYAQNYQAISYYRLDPPGTTRNNLLARIKTNISAGLPSMFGFTVFASISQAKIGGRIPFPTNGESVLGGHAVIAMGFDDGLKIKNSNPSGLETTGALMIRNSWGTGWGDGGYGWLPYEYVMRSLAVDWWSLIRQEWVDSQQFGL